MYISRCPPIHLLPGTYYAAGCGGRRLSQETQTTQSKLMFCRQHSVATFEYMSPWVHLSELPFFPLSVCSWTVAPGGRKILHISCFDCQPVICKQPPYYRILDYLRGFVHLWNSIGPQHHHLIMFPCDLRLISLRDERFFVYFITIGQNMWWFQPLRFGLAPTVDAAYWRRKMQMCPAATWVCFVLTRDAN